MRSQSSSLQACPWTTSWVSALIGRGPLTRNDPHTSLTSVYPPRSGPSPPAHPPLCPPGARSTPKPPKPTPAVRPRPSPSRPSLSVTLRYPVLARAQPRYHSPSRGSGPHRTPSLAPPGCGPPWTDQGGPTGDLPECLRPTVTHGPGTALSARPLPCPSDPSSLHPKSLTPVSPEFPHPPLSGTDPA